MIYEDLESRWKTPRKDSVPVTLLTETGPVDMKLDRFRHEAPLGDFIKEYVGHLNVPWWRRRHDWKLVERAMRERLNGIAVEWHS